MLKTLGFVSGFFLGGGGGGESLLSVKQVTTATSRPATRYPFGLEGRFEAKAGSGGPRTDPRDSSSPPPGSRETEVAAEIQGRKRRGKGAGSALLARPRGRSGALGHLRLDGGRRGAVCCGEREGEGGGGGGGGGAERREGERLPRGLPAPRGPAPTLPGCLRGLGRGHLRDRYEPGAAAREPPRLLRPSGGSRVPTPDCCQLLPAPRAAKTWSDLSTGMPRQLPPLGGGREGERVHEEWGRFLASQLPPRQTSPTF
ncbi:voltage-dependent calcium channel gamma-8 subunit-like [Canis lupus familiaris]|uniref:voltage-dependent calcium channel gamma-8 subunit-like n=1 Tax=Canis lupus familiaris TaxID=9615 RepID=UPI0018F6C4D8|nr:voltage-dependent calcium channel gamma-8 subunit-like [Canis lupus familiaris]